MEPSAIDSPPETNGSSGPIHPHFQEIGDSARTLFDESRSLATEAAATLDLRGRIERHPYQTLLIAVGVGYVLGGGLFTSLTSTLVRSSLKVAALPVVRSQLMALAEAALSGAAAPIASAADAHSPR